MKLTFIFIFALLFVSLASAEVQTLGTYKKDSCVSLVQTCGNCTYTTISNVLYPNSTVALGTVNMTSIGSSYNYSFCDTHLTGRYIVNGYSDVDGIITVWVYDFSISNTGTDLTQAYSLLYVLFMGVALILFGFVFYWSIRLPFKNNRNNDGEVVSINDLKYLKIFLICMDYIILMWLFGLMRGITLNFIPELRIDSFFYWGYVVMLSLLWPTIVVSLLFALIMFLTDKKLQETLVRGIDRSLR